MPHDDDDLGTVLLGSSDNSSDMDFDPFNPIVRKHDEQDGGDSYGNGTDAEPDHRASFLRYSGTSGEGSEGIPADDSRSVLGPGTGDTVTTGAVEQRSIDQRRARDDQLRRTAEQRSGGTKEGSGRGRVPTGMANSIRDAAERIRNDFAREPNDTERVGIGRQLEEQDSHDTQRKSPTRKITYERQAVLSPPLFRTTQFEAIVSKLQSNADGSWMLTLRIPPYDRAQATVLGDAYGLALDVTVNRRSFTRREQG